MNEEATKIPLLVIEALDRHKIRYLIGGSLASSLYGVARATLDTDLLADVQISHINGLEKDLCEQFYISKEEIEGAIKHRSSFNVIHYASAFKVDLFIPKSRPFNEEQFKHRSLVVVASDPSRSAYVASAEHTILTKLEWYKIGDEISDRQWSDVIGIIRIQGGGLNLGYLRSTAAELGISDLLDRALEAV